MFKIFFFLYSQIIVESTDCLSAIKELSYDSSSNLAKMIYYSGRDINDIGKYHECNNLDDSRYYLMMFKLNVFNMILGLCVPKSCTRNEIEENIILIVKHYKLDEKLIDTNYIEVVDPVEYNSRSMSTPAIISVTIILTLLIIALFGTFIDYQNQPTTEKKQKG